MYVVTIKPRNQDKVFIMNNILWNSFNLQWAMNETYQVSFTAYDDGSKVFKLIEVEAHIFFDNQEYVIKNLSVSHSSGVSTIQITATHISNELANLWKHEVNNGEKTYSINDVLAFYLNNNNQGYSYEVLGDFDKQQISNLGNSSAKDGITKIISTWENAVFYPDNKNIRIYHKNVFHKNNGNRLDYLHDTSEVQLTIDSTSIVNQIKAIGTQHDTTNNKAVTSVDTNSSWGWPFPNIGQGSFSGGQLFGVNAGGEFRPHGFHDGLDFGSIDHPGSEVHAIHSGTVTIKSYMNGLGNYVVISGGGYNVVYQEAFSSINKIIVNVGQNVRVGDVIGYRDTDHLHVGVTRQDFNVAVGKSFINDGTWLNPLELIKNGASAVVNTETIEETHTEKYFDDFIVEDKDSITKWGVHPAADVSDERFHDKNSMEAYVRSKLQLEPVISGSATEASNIKVIPGEIRRLEVKSFGLVTNITIVGYTWYPFDSTQSTQLSLNNLPYSILRSNTNLLKKINEISSNAAKAISRITNSDASDLETELKQYIDSKIDKTPISPTTPDKPKEQHIGKIIDVSEWQGVIGWNKVIADDVTLSIIRVQHGSAHQDYKYMENLNKCIAAGGKYAVYAYFSATSTADAQVEARDFYNRTQKVVAGKQQPLFYAIDIESIEMSGNINQMRAGVEAYMSQLNALGVPDNKIVLYIANHLYSQFNLNVARAKAIWLPSYGQNDGTIENSLKPTHPYDMWQYTSKGRVNGISGNVDMSTDLSDKFKELIFSD